MLSWARAADQKEKSQRRRPREMVPKYLGILVPEVKLISLARGVFLVGAVLEPPALRASGTIRACSLFLAREILQLPPNSFHLAPGLI